MKINRISVGLFVFCLWYPIVAQELDSASDPLTQSHSNLKQIATLLRRYSEVTNNRPLPWLRLLAVVRLENLDPTSIEGVLSFEDPETKYKYDWIYYSSESMNAGANRVIVASPRAIPSKTTGQSLRAVLFTDGRVTSLTEDQYQKALKKQFNVSQ